MRESKFKNYDALPLTLTAPEVGEVLGISRAAAYYIRGKTMMLPGNLGYPAWGAHRFQRCLADAGVPAPLALDVGRKALKAASGVILGRREAQTRESRDEKALVSEMLGSSPGMTAVVHAPVAKS